jgi:predicted nucleic acid-binding protein
VILVDTSVWIAAHRRPAAGEAVTLRALLDADEVLLALPVRLELLAGISRKDRRAFARALSGLPVVRPCEDTWHTIEGWVPWASDKGHRFGLTDLLVAALAHDADALLWSLDGDFERMASLGMARLYG